MQDHIVQKPQKSADCDQNVAQPTLQKHVVLIGMMGAGKTTLGRHLAQKLNLLFTDTDAVIEADSKCSISAYFEQYGEESFRSREFETFQRLFNGAPQIIGAGGGAVVNPDTRALIRKHAVAVWLQADIEVLVARCSGNNDRPLLHKGQPAVILGDLLEKRAKLYADTATFSIRTDSQDAAQTVAMIIEGLKLCR